MHIVRSYDEDHDCTTKTKNNMKTIIQWTTMSFFILMLTNLNAQENVIKVNPLSAAFSHGNLAYERALTNTMSLQLGVFYGVTKVTILESENIYSGLGITPEFRYYVTHKNADGPEGLFFAPFGMYRNYQLTLDKGTEYESKGSASTYGGGLAVGYQVVFGEHVTMDFFAGPNYRTSIYKVDGKIETGVDRPILIGGNGVGVRFGLTVGYAF